MSTQRCTIILPTTRPDGLPLVNQCLQRQSMQHWNLLIVVPESLLGSFAVKSDRMRIIAEPPKRPGDFYRLNGAWNAAVKAATTELLIFAVDWIWFQPDALQRFVDYHEKFPNDGVTSIGHHYRQIVNGRPEVQWHTDDRLELLERYETPYEGFPPIWWENAFCSLPRSKIMEVGGFDEEYDQFAGMSEKELACRMYANGSRFAIDPAIEIRNFTHKKANTQEEWDEAFLGATALATKHLAEIDAGTRKIIPWRGNI